MIAAFLSYFGDYALWGLFLGIFLFLFSLLAHFAIASDSNHHVDIPGHANPL